MTIKAGGRAVSIIAATIWICISGPLAAQDAESPPDMAVKLGSTVTAQKPVAFHRSARHANRYWKRHASAQRKRSRIAENSSNRKKMAMTHVPRTDDGAIAAALPSEIANANARFLSADLPADSIDSGLVSADQLNDVDRALTETAAPIPLLTMAAANTLAVVSAPIVASSEDSAWSKTSLIGKIFIAFGGLLTLASAARMFMT